MKRILTLMSSILIVTPTTSSVVACNLGGGPSSNLIPNYKADLADLKGTEVKPGLSYSKVTTLFSQTLFSEYTSASTFSLLMKINNLTDNTATVLGQIEWNKEYKVVPYDFLMDSLFKGEYEFNTKDLTLQTAFNGSFATNQLIGSKVYSNLSYLTIKKLFGWAYEDTGDKAYFNIKWTGLDETSSTKLIKEGTKVEIEASEDHEESGLKKGDSFEHTFKKLKLSEMIQDNAKYYGYYNSSVDMFNLVCWTMMDTDLYNDVKFKEIVSFENLSKKNEIQPGTIMKINTPGIEGFVEAENVSITL
ncbi:hypothetical protein SCHIN_v1c06150 [Spiroplasma chinense]|uniref:Lipoprotein n=1 Tax=Spiroplasma chinense TaxID=216932 RepID=A0A5B9Y6V7_9MOLU|nr:hypothetical protein [Spiroplasma chinense]QEH61812.1 hypothetical protein SCHIN_v1c06150 [Spiroplasma chinense]